jgi:hypothetical protein
MIPIGSKYLSSRGVYPREVSTRIGIFLGLDFTTNLTLELNSNKYLSTIPSFSFSSNFTKVLIDYSNSENATDISLLNGLFSGLTAGATFTMSSAVYSIDGAGSEANLGGTYEFQSFVGNVLVAKPITLNNFNKRLLRYESDYFVNPPQFGLSLSPEGKQIEYVIVNALGADKTNAFDKFGIYPGDKIKITGTRFNNNTFTVKSVTINKDGSENIIVNEGLTLESAFGNRVGLELLQYKKGSVDIVAATGPTTIGACGVYINGLKVECYENQTQSQCLARTSFTGGSPFVWRANSLCSSLPTTITTTVSTFTGASSTTNALASLASLGYFNSTNSVNL